MKITFSNLGTIQNTTLDLRPLTVIIGQNNTNKTYIAYSIYGLWQALNDFDLNYDHSIKFNISKQNPTSFTLKIDHTFYEAVNRFFKRHPNICFTELNTFFQDSTNEIFTGTKFEVELSKEEIDYALSRFLNDEDLEEFFGLRASLDGNLLQIQAMPEHEIFKDFDCNKQFVQDHISLYCRVHLFKSPILMPAERNAFIITYKMLANRRYKHLRQMQRGFIGRRSEERQLELLKEQGDIRYPQPIEDFLDFLTDVELVTQETRGSLVNTDFSEFADKIEEHIQGKNKTLFKPTKFGGKEIKINVKKGLNIDLYNASSSIKQLAPLLIYLRHRAHKNDLLIIDEPEMNLHPESQAKLLEVLGMLVNAGVNVLLTTHSPYFMSHLNTLVSGNTENEKKLKEQAKSLYLQDERAFLSLDAVSAYEMKNNKLLSLKHKDYGIRWDTLSDVSGEIQQKFFEIHEKGEKPTNGNKE